VTLTFRNLSSVINNLFIRSTGFVMSSTYPRIKIGKTSFATLVDTEKGVPEGAGGPCCVRIFRKLSANACYFSSYKRKLWMIVKGTLASK